MTRAFEGRLTVHYGQAYILAGADCSIDLEDSFYGQSNGLCGAALPGMLFLITGLHTGHVEFSVDVLSARPAVDDSWDEIVEVSFDVGEPLVVVQDWNGQKVVSIPLAPGVYRVRYSAKNMDEGHEIDTILEAQEAVDSYALAFWPEGASQDTVIRQTSEYAAYWHRFADGLSGRTTG